MRLEVVFILNWLSYEKSVNVHGVLNIL